MIKLLTVLNNRRTLMLGLSRANTERLHDDQPIAVDLQALLLMAGHGTAFPDVQDVVIFAGETEGEMKQTLEKHFGRLPDGA